MPNMDGWSVLRALKVDPVLQNIPVVSARVRKNPFDIIDLESCAAAGGPVARSTTSAAPRTTCW